MKKLFNLFALFMIFISIPSILFAKGNPNNKSLCDFPFGQDGSMVAYYDQRFYDAEYYPGSYPNGGISLNFFSVSFIL